MSELPNEVKKPLEGFLEDGAALLVAPIGEIGALPAFGIDESKVINDLANDNKGPSPSGLSGNPYWYPDAPWFLSGDSSKGIIRDIRGTIRDGLLRMSETLSDGIAYQLMAYQEQGELQARYTTLYGIIRET